MFDNFYGNNVKWWVGVVKEVVDEAYVKVRIFGIHPVDESELDSSDLPNAVVLYPNTGGQAGSGSISHNLEIDSWVVGISMDEHFMQPIVVGSIQGTSYSMSTYNSGTGQFVGDTYSGDGDYSDVDTQGTINIPGGSTAEKAYNYVYDKLVKEGISKDPHLHTSGLLGVLLLETPGVNPKVVGGYKGRAWGICQWLGSRRVELFKRYGRTKQLSHQLDYMWWELNNTERSAKNKWLSSTDLPGATAGFAAFERAEEWQNGRIQRGHPNFKKRLRYAYQTYNSMKR